MVGGADRASPEGERVSASPQTRVAMGDLLSKGEKGRKKNNIQKKKKKAAGSRNRVEPGAL